MADGEIKNESNMNAPGGVVRWLTALMPGRAWGVTLVLVALTAMGLAFMWWCPDVGFVTKLLVSSVRDDANG